MEDECTGEQDGAVEAPKVLTLESLKLKIDEQNGLITLMKTQIELQTEQLHKQEKLIQELMVQVKELQLKEQQRSEGGTIVPREEQNKLVNDWTNGGLAQNGSLADVVKEAAEQTLVQSGFVYDENSKLYYDYSSGYYYDPVQSLYYNGHTRTYYSYDAATKQYSFHSQLSPLPTPENITNNKVKKSKRKSSKDLKARKDMQKTKKTEHNGSVKDSRESKSKKKENKKPSKLNRRKMEEVEDGEISSSSSRSSSDSESSRDQRRGSRRKKVESQMIEISSDTEEDSDKSVKEIEPAPCIRAIVTESTLPELRKGYLFLVTCTGGTVGREGSEHAVLLPDENVSKRHAMITYGIHEPDVICDEDSEQESNTALRKQPSYLIQDLGSQNGTFLNGQRLSESKILSSFFEIVHGSTLKIGDTKLLLHIHRGVMTCGNCEPGLIIEKEPLYGRIQTAADKEATRKQEMKKLRKKYGLEPQCLTVPPKLPPNYQDRAQERRIVLGSDNPFEKTAVASIDESIKSDNKGFKMMAKMGWTVGKTLGQTEDSGLHEPIKFKVKQGRAGLGADDTPPESILEFRKSNPTSSSRGPPQISKGQLLKKTRKRFQESRTSTAPGEPKHKPTLQEEYTID